MKNRISRKSGSNKGKEIAKKTATYVVIGIILFAMIFSCFSYLIYALQSV